MKRFNLLLTTELTEILTSQSRRLGVTKAELVRDIISHYRRDPNFVQIRVKQQWKLSAKLSFNLQLDSEQDKWLEVTSQNDNCSKGDLLRYMILNYTEGQKRSIINSSIAKPTPDDPVIATIKQQLLLHNWHFLNRYLHSLPVNTIFNLGNPQLFIEVISALQRNNIINDPDLELIKAKLIWFQGYTDQAMMELDNLLIRFAGNVKVRLQITIVKCEILTDAGFRDSAYKLLEGVTGELDKVSSIWYQMKTYNKLGLSIFYRGNLKSVEECYTKASDLATNHEEIAIANRYLGSIYHDVEEFEKAEHHYKLAFAHFKHTEPNKNLDEYSRLLITYSELQISYANWPQAKRICEEAYAMASQINHLPNTAWALGVLADAHFYLGERQLAFEKVDEAIRISQLVGMNRLLGKNYLRKSKYLISIGDLNQSKEMLRLARKYELKLLGDPKSNNYNSVQKWQDYINLLQGSNINFNQLHNLSDFFETNSYRLDETKNNYVLGYLYMSSSQSKDINRGVQIMQKLRDYSTNVGNKQAQFAIESSLRFKQFVII